MKQFNGEYRMKTICRLLISVVLTFGTRNALLADPERPDLSGRVTLENGSPVANATVFIYTAGPKVGSAVVCPSCYPDCIKRAKTSAKGEFTIPALDPNLIFRLLVVAPGFDSKFEAKTDPAQGEKKITIEPLNEEKLKSATRIAGMVMDEEGKALAGATISPEGVAQGSGTSWGGTDRYVDPLAVTDDEGKFWLFCKSSVDMVHAVAEGRGVAKRWVDLKPGRDHFVRMTEGVMVTGKVVRNGQPVKDVTFGLVTKDRACGNNLRCEELATDKDGLFVLPNVPAGREFVLYATMDSLHGEGAVTSKIFTTGASGTKLELGKLEVQPAHRVAGRVTLSDGKPIPAKTRLFLGREDAWDHTEAELDAEGRFEFRGVPAEAVGLSVRVAGYKFSKRNASLDWLNGGLVGRVDGDIIDLTLLMEPGQWRYNGDEGEPPGGENQPRNKALRGAKL
jgi:uncharacterized GH25 family protein